jgi:hypothetical protein
MHTIESLRQIRALEYFLFDGVPAQPEPMYSRGAYRHHGAIRLTRRVSDTIPAKKDQPSGEIIAIAKFNLATRRITIHRP